MSAAQDHELAQWMGTSRSAEAARSRRRSNAWLQHGPADASFCGVLADLAERGGLITLTMRAGGEHRGRILEVADGWVLLVRECGDQVLLRQRCIVAVTGSDPRVSFGAPRAARAIGFAAVLERIAGERDITVRCGVAVLVGELLVVGDDLAVLASDRSSRRYVSLDAIDEVIVSVRS